MTEESVARQRPFPPGMPVNPGDVIAGKYQVVELVAMGGMGIVVAVKHLQLGHTVAMKVLLPEEAEGESQAVQRFLREARAAAGIRSDHVVRIYDVDTLPSGLPYMVMELLDGCDLRRLVRTDGPLSIGRAVDCVLQAADAIGEAHALGIVHRDLKPSNLFLTTRSDGRPCVKVLDFGISKASQEHQLEGTLTTSRSMIGSPMYMSPEQVRDAKNVDGRSDIWSLGVILHELLTATPAFKGESLPAICAAIAADAPEQISAVRDDVPSELQAIVSCCLDKDPAQRFQNVDELIHALTPFASPDTAYVPTIPAPADSASGRRSRRDPSSVSGERSRRELPPGSQGSPRSRRQKPEVEPTERVAIDHEAATLAYGGQGTGSGTGRLLSDSPLAATGASRYEPARSRGPLWIALSGLALVVVVVAVLVSGLAKKRNAVASAATTTATVKAAGFMLSVESEPPGADLLEGDRVLGKTPITLRVDAASVRGAPRVFSLALAGHRRHTFEQGPSESDVRVRQTLDALPVASAPPEVASAPPVRPPATKPPPPATGQHPAPGTDIRLSR